MSGSLYNENFERSILSSVIFDPNKIEVCQGLGLQANHFFIAFHQRLYTIIQELYVSSVVDDELIKRKMGNDFVESMMLQVMTANPVSNFEPYIKTLKELSNMREANRLASKIIDGVNSDEGYSEVLKIINEGLQNLEHNTDDLINIKRLDEIDSKEAEFIGKNWLPFPKKAVSLVTAGGGVGKSFLLLQAAMRMIDEENLKVFMWLSEDPIELSKHRYEMIAEKVLHKDTKKYVNNLHIAGSDSESIHFLEEDRHKVTVNGMFYQFKKMLSGYDVIILDPLIAMFGGDENNNTHARKFINLFTRWATVEDKTIIFIHHGTKNTSQSRGASAFVDAVRLVYQVEIIKKDEEQVEEHMRMITLAKDNNGAKKYLGNFQVKRKIFPETKKESLVVEFE